MGGEYLIGLEFILGLYNMQHVELAEKLGIKKQNINMWVKKRQSIPKKYLPVLEEIFGIQNEFFSKDLTEIEKLEMQKEKLKKDLKPVITKHEKRYKSGELNDVVDYPIYDKEEINIIERDIEKAKLVSRFKEAMDIVENNPYMDTFKLMVELMEKAGHESVLHKTIEALSHYLEVLPGRINSDEAQEEYETEIFEVFDDHNF
jgi:plasmid maintenance system antidote protein VapI